MNNSLESINLFVNTASLLVGIGILTCSVLVCTRRAERGSVVHLRPCKFFVAAMTFEYQSFALRTALCVRSGIGPVSEQLPAASP